jgi:hypothetical protein
MAQFLLDTVLEGLADGLLFNRSWWVSSMMRDIGEGGLRVRMQWSVMTRQTLDGVCLDGMC